jgi:polysaccharide export outer membrane protein
LPASLAAGALANLSAVSAPAPAEPISTSAFAPTPDVISASGPVTDTAAKADYLIGPEDVLTVTVWGEPSLSTKALVRFDGKIGMPLLGDVQASGLTTSQLREYLQDNLTKYLRTPVVSVIVTESHSRMVHVIGSVAKPGAYSLNRPLTVMQLLGLAGGFAEFAKQENVIIMRYEGSTVSRILFNYKTFISGKNLEQNILLQNRDTIIVP